MRRWPLVVGRWLPDCSKRIFFASFAAVLCDLCGQALCFRRISCPSLQSREVAAAQRLDNVRYAIRDLASVADEVTRQGHKVLALNVGDPNIFDFKTPPHLIEAVYKAMRDGKNGYAPSPGIPEALEAIRGEAARKGHFHGAGRVRDVGCQRSGGYIAHRPDQSRRTHFDSQPGLPALLRGAVQTRHCGHALRLE